MNRVLVAAVAIVVAACSGAGGAPPPLAPEPFDPVGTYAFEAMAEGQTIPGEITIERVANGFGGMVTPEVGPPPVPIRTVSVAGRQVTISGDAGGQDLIIVIDVAQDGSFTGTWAVGGDGGDLKGQKLET